MKFACVKGGTRARAISLTSVSQEAFDLARANMPADQPCLLFLLHMAAGNPGPGGILQLPEAKRLCEALITHIAEHEIAALALRRKGTSPTRDGSMSDMRNFRLGGRLRRLAQEYEKNRMEWQYECHKYARSLGARTFLIGGSTYRHIAGLIGCDGIPNGWRRRGRDQGGYWLENGGTVVVPDLRSKTGPVTQTKLNALREPMPTTLLSQAGLPIVTTCGDQVAWTTVVKLGCEHYARMGVSSETAKVRSTEDLTEIGQQEWARLVEAHTNKQASANTAQAKGGKPDRRRK